MGGKGKKEEGKEERGEREGDRRKRDCSNDSHLHRSSC